MIFLISLTLGFCFVALLFFVSGKIPVWYRNKFRGEKHELQFLNSIIHKKGKNKRVPVYCGIEIEMAGRESCILRRMKETIYGPGHTGKICLENDSDDRRQNCWSLGMDGSVLNSVSFFTVQNNRLAGLELRTPMFQSNKPPKCLTKVLDACEEEGAFVTPTSGMHIHLSAPKSYRVDAKKLAKLIEDEFGRFVKPRRRGYCYPGYSTGKSSAVRILDYHEYGNRYGNHIEIRIFNSSLNGQLSIKRLHRSIQLYRECLEIWEHKKETHCQCQYTEALWF